MKARLMAVFRRKTLNTNSKLIFHEIVIDVLGRNVQVNDAPVVLTKKKEYDMLLYFLANKGRIISKSAIAEHLWGDEMDLHDSFDFIYTHIKNLRKKLMDAGSRDYVRSIYGVGYKFIAP
ncbi:winged helix-turn-helix domain-containing protein [Mucilaginibacter humi]|uniref:winged helix-turn-helix domain-containing protein n=1 Tax=Mucilaginibacter humi TaxID=2732510 RepID=UPI00293BDC6D|nr:winged helix-turn-helix domain-containing protein [Mucilaginibacter humi]